jgi:glycerol-3-phosphate acyltransferase PlsY
MAVLLVALAVAGSYFLGGIPFSLLIGFAAGRVDIRNHGSGNVGATNLGRVCGWRYFPLAFALDFAKGLGPTLLLAPLAAAHLPPGASAVAPALIKVSVALAAVTGHVFTPYLAFRGGKGVATSAGAVAALVPAATAIAFGVWLLVFAITGTVGVASSAAATALPAAWLLLPRAPGVEAHVMGGLCLLLAVLVVVRHRTNLRDFFLGQRPPADNPPRAA